MRKIAKKAFVLLLIATFLFAAYNMASIMQNYQEIDSFNEETKEKYTPRELLNKKWNVSLPDVDFDALKEKNKDIIGWIYIPDTNVSFPVLIGKTNSQYLYQSYEKKYLTAGSIFADYRCTRDFSDRHTVIYGHNMHNGSMFGKLKKYASQEYREKHPYVYILLPDGKVNRYEVFAYCQADVEGVVFDLPIREEASDKDFARLAETIISSNQYEEDNDGTEIAGEKYLTLTTCTQDSRNDVRVCISSRLSEIGELN